VDTPSRGPGGSRPGLLPVATALLLVGALAAGGRALVERADAGSGRVAPAAAPLAAAVEVGHVSGIAGWAAGSGSGAPPASFWGDTSAIPAASNVLEVKILNQTGGQYPDSEVYWSFGGTERSVAQQPYIDVPANSAGRIVLHLGSPASGYHDFIELTAGTSSINVDSTRVDRWGLPLAVLVHSHDGTTQQAGDAYQLFTEGRAQTFARFAASVPAPFRELATIDAPYGIPSPGSDPSFQPGGQYAGYFTAYAAANGAGGVSAADVFGCAGALAQDPPLCAGLNRHVAGLPTIDEGNPADFYQAGPANYYADFWHQNAIDGLQYGFPYDDFDGQSSDLTANDPQYMVVAVGW
jgi:glycosyl hydrolase family 64 (putative beta-1,3-glucanase)